MKALRINAIRIKAKRLSDTATRLFIGLLGLLLWAALPSTLHAQRSKLPVDYAQQLYAEGNLLYQREQYEEAIHTYEQILSLPYEAWEVYYNLGNAYFKTGAYSKAILSFERAARLDPDNAEIKQNLALSRSKITNEREALPDFFLKKTWQKVVYFLSPDTWAVSLIVLAAALLLCVSAYYLSERFQIRRAAFYGILVLVVAAFIALMACISARKARFKAEAVIMVPQSEVKARPEATSETQYLLHEGNKVEILNEIAPYGKIRMSDGNQGWIPLSDMERI